MLVCFVTSCTDDDDNNGGSANSGYIEVTLNGKTYKESSNSLFYEQVAPVGTDSDDKPLTLTYDGQKHFADDGFAFFFGMVHYSRKEDLLASKTGEYRCAEKIYQKDFLNNLTFVPDDLTIDYKEYEWESGTHKVTSIKEVNGNVQIEGSFVLTYNVDDEDLIVKGKYKMIIPY